MNWNLQKLPCDALDKENYRPVSVLHHIPKIFERIMYIQIENFMEGKLSKFLTGFRENHSTQCCLVNMLEKWKKTLLIKVVLFVPYSWACKRHLTQWTTICQSPNLQEDALVFMKSYFTNRQRRVCVNSPFRYRVTNHAFLAWILFCAIMEDNEKSGRAGSGWENRLQKMIKKWKRNKNLKMARFWQYLTVQIVLTVRKTSLIIVFL